MPQPSRHAPPLARRSLFRLRPGLANGAINPRRRRQLSEDSSSSSRTTILHEDLGNGPDGHFFPDSAPVNPNNEPEKFSNPNSGLDFKAHRL
ncbi:hypothetical protein Drorol1_Dr00008585, partial [Drosera rotundifolia]